MKKIISGLLLVFAIMDLVGCNANELSDKYDKDKLRSKAEEIVNDINDNNYQAIIDSGNEDIKSGLSADDLKAAWEKRNGNIGAYKDISTVVYQEKKGIAVVVLIAEYENDKIQFTLSFNENMELAGIYIK